MKLTLEELGTLNVLLSSVSLGELVKAAQIGFEALSLTDKTSDSKELAILCSYALIALDS